MITFGKRIRRLAADLGKEEQDIAKDLDLTKSQLSHYINGNRKVPSELLQKIVDLYKINPVYLFRENAPLYVDLVKESGGEYTTNNNEYDYFPTAISAGLPFEVDGVTESKKINIPDEVLGNWRGHKDVFFTRIYGDSMDKLMDDGSLIAIKPVQSVEELRNGDIVVYSLNGEYSVKKYSRQGDTVIFKPQSYNDAHFDQVYNVDDDINIHGIVVTYVVNR